MSKVVVNLRLDKGLVERLDAAAGPRMRTRWIVAALEAALAPVEPPSRAEWVAPPPKRSVSAQRPQAVRPRVTQGTFVRASSLVDPELVDEWGKIMAARQARLNKHRDDAA